MEVFQNDIFGKKHNTKVVKEKTASAAKKEFPNFNLQTGENELTAVNDAMLIHRSLQKKLLYSGLNGFKQKSAFMKILKNELNIKAGKTDALSAVRDSLIEFFIKQKS